MQPHEQATLPQLQFRRFFEEVDHPVAGTARHSTLPMRFSRGPDRFHRRPAPLLGEHTDDVLRGLGVSNEELARLREDGVIGRTPDHREAEQVGSSRCHTSSATTRWRRRASGGSNKAGTTARRA
jgi:hypothetical protein